MEATERRVEVEKVEIRSELDEFPLLDHLGEFSDTPEEGAIEHHNGPGAFKYFNPANPEYAQEDYKRMRSFGVEWDMRRVFARVHLVVHGTTQFLDTPGLFGVESDSREDYIFGEVGREEYLTLVEILADLGILPEDVPDLGTAERVTE